MNKKGFTLVELLVVVGIVAVIVTMVVSSAVKNRAQARDKIRVADIQHIRLAVEEYRAVCGEYPATLAPTTDNGCPTGTHLEDFLPHVPTPPSVVDTDLGSWDYYPYTGLTKNSTGGKCYDYHVAAQLEDGLENDFNGGQSGYLSEDHDYVDSSGPYRYACTGSSLNNIIHEADDDSYGIYDFRSAKR